MIIAELKLREFLMKIQKEEKMNTGELVQLLDKQKKYFMLLRSDTDENMD